MDVYARQVEGFVQQAISFYHEVVVQLPGYFEAALVQAVFLSAAVMQGRNFQGVFYGDGVEHGLQVVVSVGTLGHDIQPQVYFCIRKGNHNGEVL